MFQNANELMYTQKRNSKFKEFMEGSNHIQALSEMKGAIVLSYSKELIN